MHDIDLNLIYTLHAFVEEGSLAGAARALSRSEPAISARLHRLEDELGVQIFEHVGRRLALTPAGRELHREAQDIIARLHRVVDVARAATDVPSGRLRIGTLGTVGVYMLGAPVSELVSTYPEVVVELVQGLSTTLADRLLEGDLDLVVAIGEQPVDDRVVVEIVREIRPVVVTRRDDFAEPTEFDANRLREYPLLEWALADDVFFGQVSRFLRDADLSPNVRVQVPHIATLKMLVHHGAGFAILPDYTVVEDDLVAHPLVGLEAMQPLWLAYRPIAARQPAFEAFRALLP